VLAPFEGELLFVVDAFAVKLFAVGKFSLGFHSADLAVVGDFNFGGADLLASFFRSGCDSTSGKRFIRFSPWTRFAQRAGGWRIMYTFGVGCKCPVVARS